MGLYKDALPSREQWREISEAKSYTLYERKGVWYANFRSRGRQFRWSTGFRERSEAMSFIRQFRPDERASKGSKREINEAHLVRMIERSRYRARKKKLPFDLTMSGLRAIAARCGGYCEVSGHVLEDDGPFKPSLDRIKPSKGYVLSNSRIVCLITNTAMLHYGEGALIELAATLCNKTTPSNTPRYRSTT